MKVRLSGQAGQHVANSSNNLVAHKVQAAQDHSTAGSEGSSAESVSTATRAPAPEPTGDNNEVNWEDTDEDPAELKKDRTNHAIKTVREAQALYGDADEAEMTVMMESLSEWRREKQQRTATMQYAQQAHVRAVLDHMDCEVSSMRSPRFRLLTFTLFRSTSVVISSGVTISMSSTSQFEGASHKRNPNRYMMTPHLKLYMAKVMDKDPSWYVAQLEGWLIFGGHGMSV